MSRQNGTQLLAASASGLAVTIVMLVVIGGVLGFSTAEDTNSLRALAFTQAAGPFLIAAAILVLARSVVMSTHALLLAKEDEGQASR